MRPKSWGLQPALRTPAPGAMPEAWTARVWQLRRAGVALYTAAATACLWLPCLPIIALLGRPSALQQLLQLACIPPACLAAAWAGSAALLAREPVSLPRAASAPTLKLLGPYLHYQLARSWGHLTSMACWRLCTVYAAAAGSAARAVHGSLRR